MDTSAGRVTPKRQFRTAEEKQRIVEETLAAGASVAQIARAHGVNANLVFNWRRQYQAGRLGGGNRAELLPVRIAPPDLISARATPQDCLRSSSSAGMIHIQLDHAQVRVEGGVDPELLRVLLECLER